HIEAGLRSFNKSMPEEINRITSDHCSTWLFCPTSTAVRNLEREGFSSSRQGQPSIDHPHVVMSGDVMYDNSLHFAALARKRSEVLSKLGLKENGFALATIHRPANTDDPARLASIIRSLLALVSDRDLHVVLPLHPRTRERLNAIQDAELHNSLAINDRLHVIAPVGFLEMTALEQNARIVLTDSGGVQKEAYFFGKPCVILRNETEWTELVETGMALVTDADPDRISAAVEQLLFRSMPAKEGIFGDGRAAEHICAELLASQHA
ncbi:MAG: UDP-N-acetyl glucosamine 2-epimerase, partial [Bacteroidota bacterium]|nr:UDP-N-acetyl glucosamine 2-epimerase [Bacteroidota bacterium]